MNYEREELREQLAGAYVVGVLRGPARARFERSCAASQSLGAAVRRWEDQLMPLHQDLAPATPSARVWEHIARRTRGQAPAGRRRASWRWALIGALSLSVLVAVSIRLLHPPYQVVAAVGQDKQHPLWNISRSASSSTLAIHALQPVQSNPQRAYELWALSSNGKPPVSLGLLPRSGSIERQLSASQRAALVNALRLAVSLEPAGGSPTGSPTGPVLYVAELRQPG
jgi:anti-sigma-K factor RskA